MDAIDVLPRRSPPYTYVEAGKSFDKVRMAG
jgi:hypothetical protein